MAYKTDVPSSSLLLKTNNLSDLSSASAARTSLGLLGMAVQAANAVAITGGSVSGTLIIPKIQTLSAISGNVATVANTGNFFKLDMADNYTLTNPTSPTDGQKIIWQFTQTVGNKTITLGNKFSICTEVGSVTLSTTIGKVDLMGAIYNLSIDKWMVVAFSSGLS